MFVYQKRQASTLALPRVENGVLVVFACVVSALLSGCQTATTPAHAEVLARTLLASPARLAPQLVNERYQEAKRRFAAHDYQGALVQIDLALATPDLTEQERTYLRQQKDICRAAIYGKPLETPTTTSRPRSKVTVTADCGPRALLLVCQRLGKTDTPTVDALCQVAGTGVEGTTLAGLTRAAQSVGLTAKGVQMDGNALAQLDKPAIAWVDGNHYIAVLSVQTTLTGETLATIHDPNERREQVVPTSTLLQRCGGVLLVLQPASPPHITKEEPKTAS